MRALVLAFAFAFALAACSTGRLEAPARAAPVASSLPDFELDTIDGETIRLSDVVGHSVVVLSFWATWCEPCRIELPHLDRIYRAHKDEGLVVLAISMDDPGSVAQVGPLVRENGFAFPVLLDPSSRAANLYNARKSAPHTVVIDRRQRIVSETSGFEPGAEKALEEKLVALLGVKAAR